MAAPSLPPPAFDPVKSLVQVGDGRGFVVDDPLGDRFVITAAHCLPEVPAAPGFREDWAETFQNLLGPLEGATDVWAECLFVDPIGDVAVLGSPDGQELYKQADAYDALLAAAVPLKIGDIAISGKAASARLIDLAGNMMDCTAQHIGGPLWIEKGAAGIVGGMSGSPVLDLASRAIGIVSQSGGTVETAPTSGTAPRLVASLPGRLLVKFAAVELLVEAHKSEQAYQQQIFRPRNRGHRFDRKHRGGSRANCP